MKQTELNQENFDGLCECVNELTDLLEDRQKTLGAVIDTLNRDKKRIDELESRINQLERSTTRMYADHHAVF